MGITQTTAFIDLDAIRHNFGEVRRSIRDNVAIMAIVKADAYGHGVRGVCRELVACGVDWFGVARLSEAVELRRFGIVKPILILGYTAPTLARTLGEEKLTQTVFNEDYARALSEAAVAAGVRIDCHIKLDTGMTRLGFYGGTPAETADRVAGILSLPGLRFIGIFTHFSVADETDSDSVAFTCRQGDCFAQTVEELKRRGFSFQLVHACNSAGTLGLPQYHFDMVRPGIILYGYAPDGARCARFRPAMELKTVVESVKTVGPGAAVSYGRTFVADREMRVAALAAGYADGIHRGLSGKSYVWINGELAPMIGTICMDQMMVDVTGLPVQMGDEATIFGGDSPIGADSVAGLCGTISYECVCAVTRRVPRVYLHEEGR